MQYISKDSIEGLIPCRAGLESVVAEELKKLEIDVTDTGKRAVFFETNLAGIYRANMALRCGLNVLIPIRTFNARNYDMLYYQSRKTNWHKLFAVDKTIRIDVNGGSDKLTNTEYVVHRVKDGIVDTFRKITDGTRPSIQKDDPDIHVVVHLDGTRVTLCLDTSGSPLFKRGYRTEHGGAPLKEDLAAGMLKKTDWDEKSPILDPLCGSGTFLFEAYQIAINRAPNLERNFAFESTFDYDEELHQAEKQKLKAAEHAPPEGFQLTGIESERQVVDTVESIRKEFFPEAPIEILHGRFEAIRKTFPPAYVISNPPYGIRLQVDNLGLLYRELGYFIKKNSGSYGGAIFTANDGAKQEIPLKAHKEYTLFNGRLEGRLMLFKINSTN